MTGVDLPISRLRNLFANYLWQIPGIRHEYYAVAYRNENEQGDLIAELFTGKETGKDYKEYMFSDKTDILCFFDVEDEVTNFDERAQVGVNVIFAVNLQRIYPALQYRANEEAYSDVRAVMSRVSQESINPVSISKGLNAYGDLSTEKLKRFNMHPWHTFAFNTEMTVNYDCDQKVKLTTGALTHFEYPAPIFFTS